LESHTLHFPSAFNCLWPTAFVSPPIALLFRGFLTSFDLPVYFGSHPFFSPQWSPFFFFCSWGAPPSNLSHLFLNGTGFFQTRFTSLFLSPDFLPLSFTGHPILFFPFWIGYRTFGFPHFSWNLLLLLIPPLLYEDTGKRCG